MKEESIRLRERREDGRKGSMLYVEVLRRDKIVLSEGEKGEREGGKRRKEREWVD